MNTSKTFIGAKPVILDIGFTNPLVPMAIAPSRAESDKRVPTILVVDEDIPVRRALQHTFCRNGWRADCVARPEDALLVLNHTVPDLLITELSSGTVSGWDLLFHETLERPRLPILVISALPAHAVYGADQFALEYFQKPLDVERLVAAIRRYIQPTPVIHSPGGMNNE